MKRLHIFNPEHDLALAANLSNFTSPHAGRQLRADLGFLPALWAEEGDYVLVENSEEAEKAFRRLMHRPFIGFIEKRHLPQMKAQELTVCPWGWDLALRAYLLRNGLPESMVATEQEIAEIRRLSHRREAMTLLEALQRDGTTGVAYMADSVEAVQSMAQRMGRVVVKAPWSSSGRGIRFVEGTLSPNVANWIGGVIEKQHDVMVEPYYNKVKDFGMEFESDGCGRVRYLGLSLFHTSNGAYTGNILASEEEKREMISRYLSVDLLDSVQEYICRILGARLASPSSVATWPSSSELGRPSLLRPFDGKYQGPFGIDMMVVARDDREGFLLHPCVEINLRRTMGHVALSIQREGVMLIEYTDNHYKLRIRKR